MSKLSEATENLKQALQDIINSKSELERFYQNNSHRLEKEKTKTKVALMTNSKTVFMSDLTLSTPMTFTLDPNVPTACTNGRDVKINPKFFNDLSSEERIYLIAHEIVHKMLMHPDRAAKLLKLYPGENEVVGIAVDAITNAILDQCNIGKFIEGGVKIEYGGKFTIQIGDKEVIIEETHKKTVEEVMRKMMEAKSKSKKKKSGNSDEMTQGGNSVQELDQHIYEQLSPEEKKTLEREISRQLTKSKLRGTMPSWMEEMFSDMIDVKIDLKSELREMIEPHIKSSQTYSRTNRRSQAIGVTMPGRLKEGINVFVSFDTSGSMGKPELAAGLGTVDCVFSQFEPGSVKATVLMHTTDVYKIYEDIECLTDLMDGFKIQSGGTSHKKVFAKAEEMDAEVLICYTDGYTDFPENTSIKKVIWVIIDNEKFEPPYGVVMHVGKEEL